MIRRSTTQDLGAGRQRTRITILSDACPEKGPFSLVMRQRLLDAITMQPELTQCGYEPFEKLRMYYSGEVQAWCVEVEATTDLGGMGVPTSSAGGSEQA